MTSEQLVDIVRVWDEEPTSESDWFTLAVGVAAAEQEACAVMMDALSHEDAALQLRTDTPYNCDVRALLVWASEHGRPNDVDTAELAAMRLASRVVSLERQACASRLESAGFPSEAALLRAGA